MQTTESELQTYKNNVIQTIKTTVDKLRQIEIDAEHNQKAKDELKKLKIELMTKKEIQKSIKALKESEDAKQIETFENDEFTSCQDDSENDYYDALQEQSDESSNQIKEKIRKSDIDVKSEKTQFVSYYRQSLDKKLADIDNCIKELKSQIQTLEQQLDPITIQNIHDKMNEIIDANQKKFIADKYKPKVNEDDQMNSELEPQENPDQRVMKMMNEFNSEQQTISGQINQMIEDNFKLFPQPIALDQFNDPKCMSRSTVYNECMINIKNTDYIDYKNSIKRVDIEDADMLHIRDKVVFELCLRDVACEQVDMIVNPCNSSLYFGAGGLGGVLVQKGGNEIQEQAQKWVSIFGPVQEGCCALTHAGAMQNTSYICHASGPFKYIRAMQNNEQEKEMHQCVFNCLDVAKNLGVESIAFPAISTGFKRVPPQECAEQMMQAILDWCVCCDTGSVRLVKMMCFEKETYEAFKQVYVKKVHDDVHEIII